MPGQRNDWFWLLVRLQSLETGKPHIKESLNKVLVEGFHHVAPKKNTLPALAQQKTFAVIVCLQGCAQKHFKDPARMALQNELFLVVLSLDGQSHAQRRAIQQNTMFLPQNLRSCKTKASASLSRQLRVEAIK